MDFHLSFRIDQSLTEGHEPDEDDIKLLKHELFAVLVAALQKDK